MCRKSLFESFFSFWLPLTYSTGPQFFSQYCWGFCFWTTLGSFQCVSWSSDLLREEDPIVPHQVQSCLSPLCFSQWDLTWTWGEGQWAAPSWGLTVPHRKPWFISLESDRLLQELFPHVKARMLENILCPKGYYRLVILQNSACIIITWVGLFRHRLLGLSLESRIP